MTLPCQGRGKIGTECFGSGVGATSTTFLEARLALSTHRRSTSPILLTLPEALPVTEPKSQLAGGAGRAGSLGTLTFAELPWVWCW